MDKITMLTNADIRKVDLVPAGAQQLSKISIMKSKEEKTVKDVKKQDLTDEELAEVQCLLDQLKEKLGIEDITETNEVKPTDTDKPEDNTEKALSGCESGNAEKAVGDCAKGNEVKEEEIKEQENEVAKAAIAKAADLEAQNNQLKEQIAKMNEEKIEKSFVAKASEMTNIPGMKTDKLGQVLKSVYENCGKDTYDALESVLKSANEVIGTGSIFVEKGTSAGATVDPQTKEEAWEMLEALAANRVTKGLSNSGNAMGDVLQTPEGAQLYLKYKSL